jgi:Protein of unknown function (DUF2726)
MAEGHFASLLRRTSGAQKAGKEVSRERAVRVDGRRGQWSVETSEAEQRAARRLREPILQPLQYHFHKALRRVISHRAVICPMASLQEVLATSGVKRTITDRTWVDFLVCETNSMTPLCGIQVTASATAPADETTLAHLFAAAGVPLLRIHAGFGCTPAVLAEVLAPHLPGIVEEEPAAPVEADTVFLTREDFAAGGPDLH